MPPFLGGGEMIREVKLTKSEWNELPWKFEAGTMAIAEAIGFGAAVDYLETLGMDAVFAHDRELVRYAMQRLAEIPEVKILGPAADKRGGLVAFELGGIHPHDVATVLDGDGIAVRAGHHCAMPLHEALGVPASARASFHCYSVPEDVDALVAGLKKTLKVFAAR
jgi:cysteine desulfurase/selenocysteine lyase